MHQWKTFPTEHMEGCDDVHSTISRGLLLHPGQHHRKTTIKTLSFRYFSYRAQSFILDCYNSQDEQWLEGGIL